MKRILAAAAAFLLTANLAHAQWPPVGSGTGTGSVEPAVFSSPAGTGVWGGSTNAVTFDVDTSVIPTYATGTSLPATCTPFASSFLDTDSTTTVSFDCISNDLWAGRFTIADDAVLVGTGTTTASKAIPDCDDSAGQHLNYDTATNAFSCGTSGGSSSFDPASISWSDDFVSGLVTTGNIGRLGWGFNAASTGTLSAPDVTDGNHPGLIRLNSHATNDDSGIVMFLAANAGKPYILSGGDWSMDVAFLVGSNSTAITSVGFYVGASVSASAIPNATSNFFGIRYDTDKGDSTFVVMMCNASGAAGCGAAGDDTNSKVTASTVTPVAGTWHRFRFRRSSTEGPGSTALYGARVDSESEVTFCSSGCSDTIVAPTLNFPVVVYVTRTTTGVMSGDIDYYAGTISGLSR